ARATVRIVRLRVEPAAGTLYEWIVAARIKDDQIQVVFRIAHFLQHFLCFDPLSHDLIHILDVGVYWEEKILPLYLQAMAGKIEQANPPTLDSLTEFTDGIRHLPL